MGRLHPLDYFKNSDYKFQCAPDPTRYSFAHFFRYFFKYTTLPPNNSPPSSKYMKSPRFYLKYKSPQVLPLTLERTNAGPLLPHRALTGRYNPGSDIVYKR